MQTIDLKFPLSVIEDLFPSGTSEEDFGENVTPTIAATARAAAELDVPWQEVKWRCPDVFSIRYGSSYVATALAGDKQVRFHSDEGDFIEGDDQ